MVTEVTFLPLNRMLSNSRSVSKLWQGFYGYAAQSGQHLRVSKVQRYNTYNSRHVKKNRKSSGTNTSYSFTNDNTTSVMAKYIINNLRAFSWWNQKKKNNKGKRRKKIIGRDHEHP